MALVKESSTPLYQQLEELIVEKIKQGEWRPGTQIPSEMELCRVYGISRLTVRKALDRLVLTNQLERYPGKGTFVAPEKIPQNVSLIASFHQKMRDSLGLEVKSKVLGVHKAPAESHIRRILQLNPDEWVYTIRRVRYIQETPLVIHTAIVPEKICPNLSQQDLAGSITKVLEQVYGVKQQTIHPEIEATLALPDEAKLLEISAGDPILKLTILSHNADGVPVRYAVGRYRADKVKFTLGDTHLNVSTLGSHLLEEDFIVPYGPYSPAP